MERLKTRNDYIKQGIHPVRNVRNVRNCHEFSKFRENVINCQEFFNNSWIVGKMSGIPRSIPVSFA